MSKIAKKPLNIPEGVTVTEKEDSFHVEGPKGSLSVMKLDFVTVTIAAEEKTITITPAKKSPQAQMNWGTQWSLLNNALLGVVEGFSKSLILEGVGYRVAVEGNNLNLKVGFSHPVIFPIPEGITIAVEKNTMNITGIDKHLVGHVASRIRKIKKPEPYLGKGIRYSDEIIRRKEGKKASG